MADNFFVNFYGGEPLLAFDLIQQITNFIETESKVFRKKPRLSITTNGSLLNNEMIEFLDEYKFSVVLSFDGLAQDVQRKKGSYQLILSNLKKLMACEGVGLEVNSVFTPDSVGLFSKSIQHLLEIGAPRVRYSLSYLKPWDAEAIACFESELRVVCNHIETNFIELTESPIANFKDLRTEKVSCCPAGQDRITITPNGEIWGCPLFPDYFERFGDRGEMYRFLFGNIKDIGNKFPEQFEKVFRNYSQLRMDHYSTSKAECFLCPHIGFCSLCPVSSSFSGKPLKRIPDFICKIQKIKIKILSGFSIEGSNTL